MEAFVRSIELLVAEEGEERVGYPWALPVIGALARPPGHSIRGSHI